VIDQSGESCFELYDGGSAGNAIGSGFDDRAGFSGALLGAIQIAVRADFVVAGDSRDRRVGSRTEVADHLFGDHADDLFVFVLIHSLDPAESRHGIR
jgi:hypothetical protein